MAGYRIELEVTADSAKVWYAKLAVEDIIDDAVELIEQVASNAWVIEVGDLEIGQEVRDELDRDLWQDIGQGEYTINAQEIEEEV